MKKSSIYLGASATILAIAGAFTTKGSTKVKIHLGWTRVAGTSTCSAGYQVICSNSSTVTCKTTGGVRTLYTVNTSGRCLNKLHTGFE